MGLAVIALEGLRANPGRFQQALNTWPGKLRDAIHKAAQLDPVTKRLLPANITELYQALFGVYMMPEYCLAQLLLSLLAKTVQGTS